MKPLALALQQARDHAFGEVALESIAEELGNFDRSYEDVVEEQETMTALADGLGKIVVSAEALSDDDHVAHRGLYLAALEHLQVAGVSMEEAQEILPAPEKSAARRGWERFKEFLRKLWKFIVEAAKRIFQVVDGLLKKSSVAEQMAFAQLRRLRLAANEKKAGLSVEPVLPLRPAHRYFFTPDGVPKNFTELQRNVAAFKEARNRIQNTLPQVIDQMIENLTSAVNALNVTHEDDAVVSASITQNLPAIIKAFEPMYPENLAVALGATNMQIPLVFDRMIELHVPDETVLNADAPEDVAHYISQLGLSVGQVEVKSVDLEKLGTFPAMRHDEIQQLLRLATSLLEENQSTDQTRAWKLLQTKIKVFNKVLDKVVNVILKRRSGLTPEARIGLRLTLTAMQAIARWAAAPYVQLNAVNVRVCQSVLAMAQDQLNNYDDTDTMEERRRKPQSDKKSGE